MNKLSSKKKILIFLIIISCSNMFGQLTLGGGSAASISADLPVFSPASPSVAGLMKFEEIPVNNYTGIPDISFPLYNIQTHSKDINFDMSLKYHPASIAVKEVASYTGLGWNLVAGGAISRLVKGLPDEILRYGNINGPITPRVGMYNNDVPTRPNNYYKIMNLTATQEETNEFLWNAFERGIYDTEHDLYQYNFMGHTGRFYIQKNISTGVLEVIKLDNNNSLDIQFFYTHNSSNENLNTDKYNFNRFEIFDDKGYRFVFAAKEVTTEIRSSLNQGWGLAPATPSIIDPLEYISSFHLTAIYDNNDKLLASFTHQDSVEKVTETSTFNSYPSDMEWAITLETLTDNGATILGIPPRYAEYHLGKTIVTKKLQQISIINKAKIIFENEPGRYDHNINSTATKLKGVSIFNWNDQLIKKYSFTYQYLVVTALGQNSTNIRRLALSNISQHNVHNNETLIYKFGYKEGPATVQYIREDYWGYLRRGGFDKKTDPLYCMTHALTSMDTPTGGHIVFDFESNTYSYTGDKELTVFNNDTDYYDDHFILVIPPNQTSSNPLIVIPDIDRDISIAPESTGPYYYRMRNENSGEEISLDVPGMTKLNDGSGTTSAISLKKDNQYIITLVRRDSTTTEIRGSIQMFSKVLPTDPSPVPKRKEIYGGGIRIKKISYFKDINDSLPAKEKHYSYNFFNEPDRTSGSLSFPRPVYKYKLWRNIHFEYSPPLGGGGGGSIQFEITTNHNNLLNVRTQGADVGYKNVRVWETENGKSEYVYTSPIDYPEAEYTVTYPFVGSSNVDYKRGLLINEKHYEQLSGTGQLFRILNETNYSYPQENMDELISQTGIRTSTPYGCPFSSNFNTFADFIYCVTTGTCFNGYPSYSCDPWFYIQFTPVISAFGWPKLMSKDTKEYFYDTNNALDGILENKESFTYHSNNKMIATHTTDTYKDGVNVETLKKTYSYNTFSNNNISSINTIVTEKDNVVLSTQKVLYSSFPNNASMLPKTIQVSKGSQPLENRVHFEAYDEFGNVLEVKPDRGTSVSYIYGYNKTVPVAMIENATFNSLSPLHMGNIQTASNGTSETALLAALDHYRNLLYNNNPGVILTTYTYKPLVGVTSVTDPKGYRTTYGYDGFGRLIWVKDMNGNLLSENEYHYKP